MSNALLVVDWPLDVAINLWVPAVSNLQIVKDGATPSILGGTGKAWDRPSRPIGMSDV